MSLIFFLDRNLGGKTFPSILRNAGVSVILLEDHFTHMAPDEEWITWVGQKGYYALGNDARIYRNKIQREVVMKSGLGYFVIRDAQSTAKDSAENFLATYSRIERFVQKTPRPFIATILRPLKGETAGRVSLRYPRQED